jgi:hypothetical protein
MATPYFCKNERRRAAVRNTQGMDGKPLLNGLDYLEVSSDQKSLTLHFIHNLPGQTDGVPPMPPLTKENVVIEGGVRVQNVRVESVSAFHDTLTVSVNTAGDFSTYTLGLVTSLTNPAPPPGFDVQLSAIAFSFKVDCPSEFDCQPIIVCPSTRLPEPLINYLAKDYASFRRLMLDRLAVIMPDWQERNPADLGIALVELLAYTGDYLSYSQDAVATEAYLGTARRRVSVRRHARMVDYFMHDGANARVWVTLQVTGGAAEGVVLPGPSMDMPGTQLCTHVNTLPVVLEAPDLPVALSAGAEVFETMHDIVLRAAHNAIQFYTWGDEDCCLPTGATRATLRQKTVDGHVVQLARGDVLLFEEVRGAQSGLPADADPSHRHIIRLTGVQVGTDALYQEGNPPEPVSVVEIQWALDDALPFPLCLSRGDQPVSVARGNTVLSDHGRTISGEALTTPAVLQFGPLTHQGRRRDRNNTLVLFSTHAPASAAYRWEIRYARPAIALQEGGATGVRWQPQRDLLNSDRFASDFVVEMEEDGRAHLRFGDGVLGREPAAALTATYRVGNGRAGNVGPEAIAHIFLDPVRVPGAGQMKGAISLRNPLPAQGGTDPESLEQVRLYAPQAFRTQERAVTESDYAAAAQRHPDVQRAAATRRWTGSWYTMFITVDRQGGRPVDIEFEAELRLFLERFRMAGYDLEIEGPRFVPLDIAFTVCVAPGYFHSSVKKALLDVFSNADLPNGRRGFFHPDNFTFGQPVYLSQIVATAMQVPGVAWVDVDETPPRLNRFRRWGQLSHGELAAGRLTFGRLEIARLDNDPNEPENGKIEFFMEGGL